MTESSRIQAGRNLTPSLIITDAQSIKNASSAETKGYDAGKKVSGIKLHIAVDTLGLPHFIEITKASVTDRDGAIQMFQNTFENIPTLQKLLVDGGYTGPNFAATVKELLKIETEVSKRSDKPGFNVIPKRWIVERTFAWLEKCRRLWRNCERLLESTKGMIQVALIRIMVKRF
jgi:transposase